MAIKILIGTLLLSLVAITGCTSSTYGNSFEAVATNQPAAKNQYKLKVYTGGFAGPEYARKDLDVEAKEFMQQNPKYKSYKIISEKFELVPSGVTFVVEFTE
jgi:hypothetical protein